MELINMSTSREERDKMNVLFEASFRGCVPTLNSLIQQHPQILYRISQTSFPETPLHISALLGHLDFTKALLTHNPKLTLELDSTRSTPLHLASAEGHIDIVKELVKVNKEACLIPDEERRIPLHNAAMRGRREVAIELTKAKTESLRFLHNGNTILHLCVIYNHLETLKALVELELHITGDDLLNFAGSDGGNTILHLAVMLKQVETTRYLLSISKIREAVSMKNDMGFTVHDILEQSPKDLKNLEIQLMLLKASNKAEEKGTDTQAQAHPSPTVPPARPRKHNCCIKTFKGIGNWFKLSDDWLEQMRGNLSLVSTVISTITFQALVNPPGGFIQQGLASASALANPTSCFIQQGLSPPPDNSNPLGASLHCSNLDGTNYCPGQAISSFNYPTIFRQFLICNTFSFVSSLSVTLLLVSGFPLKNKAVIWLLSLGMCVALTFLAAAYFLAGGMVIPCKFWETTYDYIYLFSNLAWFGLLSLITVFIALRLFIWVGKKCVRAIKLMARGVRNHKGCCCFV